MPLNPKAPPLPPRSHLSKAHLKSWRVKVPSLGCLQAIPILTFLQDKVRWAHTWEERGGIALGEDTPYGGVMRGTGGLRVSPGSPFSFSFLKQKMEATVVIPVYLTGC